MSDKIKVVVKVRPLIAREIEDKLTNQWQVKDNSIYLVNQNGKDHVQNFTFDKVYNIDTTTKNIYDDIAKPIVEAAVRGINGTIFAYGQTSSGKTYIMSGTEESPGIVQLAVNDLFNLIKNVQNRDFLLRVSYMEMYNENIYDLLSTEKTKMKIHETMQGIKVDISEKIISTPDDVFSIMNQGEVNRRVGATDMNEESSRSHSVFQIIIESRAHSENPDEESCARVSQLNLVDLAGSERAGQTGATGLRFKEGTHINKSLSTLALVIKQLADQQKHVSYRDSKLTRILQNSLGGNANTSIVCAVTPASIEETVSTLQFASRAKLIENKPVVNEVHTNATKIQALTKEIARLQMKIESTKMIENDNKILSMRLKEMRRQILSGYCEPRKLAVPRRATICTTQLQTIHEQPHRSILIGPNTVFKPIQEKRVTISDEIIEIDSDDDDDDGEVEVEMNNAPCSPRHKCYAESQTPPCVLRDKVKRAERDYQEIVEMSELEKLYAPTIIELQEQINVKDGMITELQQQVKHLNTENEQQKLQLDSEIQKRDVDIKNIQQSLGTLQEQCKLYDTKLAEWEISYETLKSKSRNREEELLSLLEDKENCHKSHEKPLVNFLDMSRDITLVTSDTEEEDVKDDYAHAQKQISDKNIMIQELEKEIEMQKLKIISLEINNTDVSNLCKNLEDKVEGYVEENKLLKVTIDTLNSTIQSQRSNMEVLTGDIIAFNEAIKKMHLTNNNDAVTENIIDIEDSLLINNEHIRLLVTDFKTCIAAKNKEINALKEQNQCDELKVILDEKEKALSKVELELLGVKEEILSKEEQIAELVKENEASIKSNGCISRQLAEIEDENKCLQLKLKEVAAEKDKEIEAKEVLLVQLGTVIEKLEKDNSTQQNLILTLTGNNPSKQVKLLIEKIKSVLSCLTPSANFEEVICNDFDEAVVALNSYLSDTATSVAELMCEKRDIEENVVNLKNELEILKERNFAMQQKIMNNDLLKQKYNQLADQLQQINGSFEMVSKENEDRLVQIKELNTEIANKDAQLIEKQKELVLFQVKCESMAEDMDKFNKLEQDIIDMTAELNRSKTELYVRNSVLNDIVAAIVRLANSLKADDTIRSDDLIDNYEKIPAFIDDLIRQLRDIKKFENEEVHTEEGDYKRLVEDVFELNVNLDSANKTIQGLRDDNKNLNDNLLNIKNIIECLKLELCSKNEEVNKIRLAKEDLKRDLENTRCENEVLNQLIKEMESKIIMHEENTIEQASELVPSTLSKISLEAVVKCVYTDVVRGITTPNSQPEMRCGCECIILDRENEISSLKVKLEELTSLNRNLEKNAEEAKQEIVLLTELSGELYKKILNHRASLSIFTATTYAENKLLKIQMKALLHHHSRMHNACRRDVSDMKSKLGTLLRILENDPNSASALNNSFKRFSWPNTSLYTLKNDSNITVDSDLLMIDTNVTLATVYNSTLVQDDTCASRMNPEAECDEKKAECMGILLTDNIYEQLERLIEENQSLKQQIEQLAEKNSLLQATDKIMSPCNKCKRLEELKVQVEHFKNDAKEFDTLSLQLKELCVEKENIEVKYNDVMSKFELEQTATCDRLQNLERECDDRSKEIAALKETLNGRVAELKQLKNENISLSTDLMDAISESDEHRKEIDDLKANTKTQLDTACSQCDIKDKIIEALESNSKANNSNGNTSLVFDKYCTLQSEICASREECEAITKEVETMKSELERSNMSHTAINIDVGKLEEKSLESYFNDKSECFDFFTQIVSTDKVFNDQMKLIDMMKLLYDSVKTEHATEVQNLMNTITHYEESHALLQSKFDDITMRHEKVCEELDVEKRVVLEFAKVVENLKSYIDDIGRLMELPSNYENNMKIVSLFKENILQTFDRDFSLPVSPIFESILDNIGIKQEDFDEVSNKCKLLQNKLEVVLSESNTTSENLIQTKVELKEMEEQYNKLRVQNKRVDEITAAVTLDLVRREEQMRGLIEEGMKIVGHETEPTSSAQESLVIFLKHVNESNVVSKKRQEDLEKEVGIIKAELERKSDKITLCQKEIVVLQKCLEEKEEQLFDQNKQINNLTTLNNKCTEDLITNMKCISEKDSEIVDILNKIDTKEEENDKLKALYNAIIEERDISNSELKDAEVMIDDLKEKNYILTKEVDKLKVSLENNISNINELNTKIKNMFDECENLRSEKQKLSVKLTDSENVIAKKNAEIQQMQVNVKTVETSAEILNNYIKRITKEKEDVESERDTKIAELQTQLNELQQSYDALIFEQKDSRSRSGVTNGTSTEKCDSFEFTNCDAFVNDRRERLRSLFDNNRPLPVTPDGDDMAAMFAKRSETEDMFKKNDSNSSSANSTSRFNSSVRNEQDNDAEKKCTSLSDSITATRLRRQSIHDMHRVSLHLQDWSNLHSVVVDRMSYDAAIEDNRRLTRALEEFHAKNRDLKALLAKYESKLNNDTNVSEISRLRSELSSCRSQCESLERQVQELDNECEECARALKESDQQCDTLQSRARELSAMLEKCTCLRKSNQDEHDTIEELQQKNRELQHKLRMIQKKVDRDSLGRDLDAANEELTKLKAMNAKLANKCHLLSEKCDQRQALLTEKESYCTLLTEKHVQLEEKVMELQEQTDKSLNFKRKRHSLHDQQREIATNTEECENVMALEIQNLKKQIETMKTASKTVYVDTGSAIVQNQQISDVMRENQKLLKANEKLTRLCKKRGKLLSDENRDNLRP